MEAAESAAGLVRLQAGREDSEGEDPQMLGEPCGGLKGKPAPALVCTVIQKKSVCSCRTMTRSTFISKSQFSAVRVE